jgi:biopolymer transport protein ExbD
VLEVENEQTLRLGGETVTLEGLADALREVEKAHPGRGVALQADENLPYRVIVRLFDAIRQRVGLKSRQRTYQGGRMPQGGPEAPSPTPAE